MTVTESVVGDKVQLNVSGRIDMASSDQLLSAILAGFQKAKNLILDLEKVDYISSAGLRSLLIGQKTANSKAGSLVLINVQDTVRQVIEITGFVQMLHME